MAALAALLLIGPYLGIHILSSAPERSVLESTPTSSVTPSRRPARPRDAAEQKARTPEIRSRDSFSELEKLLSKE